MKKIILLLIASLFSVSSAFAVLLNSELLDVKMELDNMYYDAAAKHKLPIKKIQRLDEIKAGLDNTKKNINSNVVPIYYKLGLTYRAINKEDQAIDCFRTIVKYYPSSPLRKKSLIYLKYLGEAVEVDGRTMMLPYKEDSDEIKTENID